MKLFKYIILILFLIFACDADNGTDPDLTAEELIAQGWENFESADYSAALTSFEEAISKDETIADAFNGAGWTNGRLTNLTDAVSRFSSAITLNANLTDAHAGLAFAHNAQKSYQSAINSANTAIGLESGWDFSHDETLDYKDLHLLLAESYFATLDFTSSLAQVQILNPSFTADVNTFDGRSALAAEIERLRQSV